MFQHYSIEASRAIAGSHCLSIQCEGIDLTNMVLTEPPEFRAPPVEDIENPRRAVDGQEDVFEDNFVSCGFEHPSFSFIDDNAPSVNTTIEDRSCDESNNLDPNYLIGSEDRTVSLAEEPEMPSPGAVHFSGLEPCWDTDGMSGGRGSNCRKTCPSTPPHTTVKTSCNTPTNIADFSPIREERYLSSNAGCFKFPIDVLRSPNIPTLKGDQFKPSLTDFASTPCPRPSMKPLPFSRTESNDSIFCDVKKDLSVKAPLASPEASLADSLSDLDDTCDESMNVSSYDNVPSQSAETSVGSYLDNVSGLTYSSPSKKQLRKIIGEVCRPLPAMERLTTV